uniref:Glycine-rich protein n=1 Tax=Strongyloides venezuelensis TaxID=75913 RepID=A0A0K0FDM1_STRVS
MQILGYIVAAVAFVSTLEAIPQFGHHGFGGPMMRGGHGGFGGGPRGFGGHGGHGGFGGHGRMGGGPAVVSKTVMTKTVVRG